MYNSLRASIKLNSLPNSDLKVTKKDSKIKQILSLPTTLVFFWLIPHSELKLTTYCSLSSKKRSGIVIFSQENRPRKPFPGFQVCKVTKIVQLQKCSKVGFYGIYTLYLNLFLLFKTQFQIEGGGEVQGVTKLISTFSTFVT